jgi:hypothetical protein
MPKRVDETQSSRPSNRTRLDLMTTAKNQLVIASDTEPLEHASAKIALPDDFGIRLVRRKGSIAKDIDLGF